MKTALEVKNLTKTYENFRLDRASFTVQSGRIMGFIGRNGAGKTTTLKSILKLVHPDEGSIRFFGMEMKEREFEIKQRTAIIFGGADYYQHSDLKTVAGVYRRFYSTWDEAHYRDYLARFGLDPVKKIKQLSQGMRIKFALALALSHHAELLILDEPTSGLDPVSRDELLTIFEDIVDREGAGILFSTHITSDLDRNADDITYIKDGIILASQEKSTFIDSYRMVEAPTASLPGDLKKKVIGGRERKEAFAGLLRKEDALAFSGLQVLPADLESIMVYTERGEQYE